MGDFDLIEDEVSTEVSGIDVLDTTGPLHIPQTWTDTDVQRFEQAVATLPTEKRGVTVLKTRFGDFKRHYELLNRDTAKLQRTINYINGVRSGGPKKDATKALRKTAQAFFSGMSEAILYKQAKVFGLNVAMYDTNEALIAALVDQHIAAHTE